ncbi:hypothetical protein C7413_101214 [Paraburkholderia silvatlantica]|nr:hypothetical protein C7411_101214 [Paraburkholderia silvatlantica]PXW42561.1 hypothetical protein C7413_101214 [Paraburkholderia silvatlantica]TDR05034.1 hypothetical protein C7412_101279 [Paraburkholderia silvatlantica]
MRGSPPTVWSGRACCSARPPCRSRRLQQSAVTRTRAASAIALRRARRRAERLSSSIPDVVVCPPVPPCVAPCFDAPLDLVAATGPAYRDVMPRTFTAKSPPCSEPSSNRLRALALFSPCRALCAQFCVASRFWLRRQWRQCLRSRSLHTAPAPILNYALHGSPNHTWIPERPILAAPRQHSLPSLWRSIAASNSRHAPPAKIPHTAEALSQCAVRAGNEAPCQRRSRWPSL